MKIWSLIIFMISITLSCVDEETSTALKTVEMVDISRYAGLWYEAAKIPNRFQKRCDRNTTAFYSIRDDGRLAVVNQCEETDGTVIKAEGLAKISDTITCAKLRVSFFKIFGIPVYLGDYWIIGLDDDYQWAVIGTPNRKYGWVLSREPSINDQTWKIINQILTGQGYLPEDFVKTRNTQPKK
jgi:apolipoprotein D and lipocalin family protein